MEIKFNSGVGLISLYFDGKPHSWGWSIHFGVYPREQCVYKRTPDGKGLREVYCNYIWGRAIEQYDCNGDYFGLGPLLLICW